MADATINVSSTGVLTLSGTSSEVSIDSQNVDVEGAATLNLQGSGLDGININSQELTNPTTNQTVSDTPFEISVSSGTITIFDDGSHSGASWPFRLRINGNWLPDPQIYNKPSEE